MNVKPAIGMYSFSALLAGLSLALLGGCASQPGTDAERVATQRANERWQYLMKGVTQWPKAYDMIESSYRATHDFDAYVDGFVTKVRWKKAQVVSATCEAEVCRVRLAVTAELPNAGAVETAVDETWVREGEQWYYHLP